MINKKFIKDLKGNYEKREGERRQIISLSNIILYDSKRVIFSLHRKNVKQAEEMLDNAEKALANLEKKFGFERISEEGAYKAACEEYVEAKMFNFYIKGKEVGKIDGLKLNMESVLGGLCDFTGELVRLAVNKASEGKFKEVEKIKKAINEVMGELVEFNMAGYLRTKYDQAKGNLKKIEQISYEIKIREK